MASEHIAIIVASITAVAGLITALINLFNSRRLRRNQEAVIINEFSKRYSQEDMRKSLNRLSELYHRSPTHFMDELLEIQSKESGRYEEIMGARRHVFRFYKDISRLVATKAVDRRIARVILEDHGLNVFYNICVPMNLALNKNPTEVRNIERTLKKCLADFDDGQIFKVF